MWFTNVPWHPPPTSVLCAREPTGASIPGWVLTNAVPTGPSGDRSASTGVVQGNYFPEGLRVKGNRWIFRPPTDPGIQKNTFHLLGTKIQKWDPLIFFPLQIHFPVRKRQNFGNFVWWQVRLRLASSGLRWQFPREEAWGGGVGRCKNKGDNRAKKR